jgi:hypothetical protein
MKELTKVYEMEEEKIKERVILLKKAFDVVVYIEGQVSMLQIGKELGDEYCSRFNERGYDSNYNRCDENEVVNRVARKIDDQQLLKIFEKYKGKLKTYYDFKGKYYTYIGSKQEFRIRSEWPSLEVEMEKLFTKYGKDVSSLLEACFKVIVEMDKKWDNYLYIQNIAKDLGCNKGWRKALTDLEIIGVISRHKGDIGIPEELLPFVNEILEKWKKRPLPISEKPIKISKHKVLENLVACFPSEVFQEPMRLFKNPFKLNSGDEIDLVLIDASGKHVLVEVKPEYEEKAVSQLLRYKDEYSSQVGIDKKDIRLSIVCSKEVEEKFLKALRENGIEVYYLRVIGKKIY